MSGVHCVCGVVSVTRFVGMAWFVGMVAVVWYNISYCLSGTYSRVRCFALCMWYCMGYSMALVRHGIGYGTVLRNSLTAWWGAAPVLFRRAAVWVVRFVVVFSPYL